MSMIGRVSAVDVADPDQVLAQILDGSVNGIALDKAWHAIHFLLTGTAWDGDLPAGFLLAGTPIGDEDLGYGPARLLDPAQVREVADLLRATDRATLWARWDSEAIAKLEIYGVDPKRPASEEEYVGAHYEVLRQYVLDAAARGEGLALWLE